MRAGEMWHIHQQETFSGLRKKQIMKLWQKRFVRDCDRELDSRMSLNQCRCAIRAEQSFAFCFLPLLSLLLQKLFKIFSASIKIELNTTMASNSKIEWTEAIWNPITGCDKISPRCKHCCAERLALRLQAAGVGQYKDGFKVTLHPDSLELPLTWKKPKVIFVNSMSDLFNQSVPLDFILQVFSVMRRATQHQFQILTKRAELLTELETQLSWPIIFGWE